jgi:hypothetical protein
MCEDIYRIVAIALIRDNVRILHEKTGREKNASRHSKSFVQGFGM